MTSVIPALELEWKRHRILRSSVSLSASITKMWLEKVEILNNHQKYHSTKEYIRDVAHCFLKHVLLDHLWKRHRNNFLSSLIPIDFLIFPSRWYLHFLLLNSTRDWLTSFIFIDWSPKQENYFFLSFPETLN